LVKVILGQAEEEFKAFVEKSDYCMDYLVCITEHPLNVGMLGMHGNWTQY
jgi:acetolactate synthase-1/2/3 large subunit